MTGVRTIAAPATAAAPAGVALIRISGPQAGSVLQRCFNASLDPRSQPRSLIFGSVRDPSTGQVLDRGLAVFMPGPNSYTGEDTAELHIHGSPLLVQSILKVLYANGAEPAEPGEFTKRAFLNGKLDLLQAESVADIINASGEHALRIGQEQLKGRLSTVIQAVGEPLRDILAEIEAQIDFPEEDIEPAALRQIERGVQETMNSIGRLLKTYSCGRRIKEGFRVLLWGRPNAGKSSLLNALLGEERAIVTEVPGTTRDVIEERAIIDGHAFIFCDCAGVQESSDKVERIGVELALARLDWADLVLFVTDASEQPEAWHALLPKLPAAKAVWLISNKIDLISAPAPGASPPPPCSRRFHISALQGTGLGELNNALLMEMAGAKETDSVMITSERHYQCLLRANQALQRSSEALQRELPLELVSSELRAALSALEELIGRTATEDILGRIFAKFCIGK